jgi:hypothetical protein
MFRYVSGDIHAVRRFAIDHFNRCKLAGEYYGRQPMRRVSFLARRVIAFGK